MASKGFQITMIICLLLLTADAHSSGIRTERLGEWGLWISDVSDIGKVELSTPRGHRDFRLAKQIALEKFVAHIRRNIGELGKDYTYNDLWQNHEYVYLGYFGHLIRDNCKDLREFGHMRCYLRKKLMRELWRNREELMGGSVGHLKRIRDSRREPLLVSGGYNSDMKRIRLGPVLDVPKFWEHDKFDGAVPSVKSENGDEIKDDMFEIDIFQIQKQ